MAPVRNDEKRVRARGSEVAPAASRAVAAEQSGPRMARPTRAPEGDGSVRIGGRRRDDSVPPGGESLTPADIERLTPVLLDRNGDQIELPTALRLTRAEAEAIIPYFVSDKTKSAARIDGNELVLSTKPGDEALRVQLSDVAVPADAKSPVARIAHVARTAPADKPLLGLRIALDPGHFGSEEDLLEGKWVSATPHPPGATVPDDTVCEGTITGQSARELTALLRGLGAHVTITRQGDVSRVRNRVEIAEYLKAHPDVPTKPSALLTGLDLERRSERLSNVKPDIILTMHFDAEVNNVSDKARKEVKAYVNGAFVPTDFTSRRQLQRFCTTFQSHAWHASTALAGTIIKSVCKATGAHPQLPADTGAVNPKFLIPVGDDTGVFARNLRQPTAITGEPLNVYLEGATYNHPDVFPLALRDSKTPDGVPGGFVDTYARALADGVVSFVRSQA